jgi:glutamine synthetase
MSKENVLKMIKDEDAAYVDIRFTDPRGKLQHVTVMSDLVDEDFLDEGFMFDGSSIAGWKGIEAVGHETDARHRQRLCRSVLRGKDDLSALLHRRARHRRGL